MPPGCLDGLDDAPPEGLHISSSDPVLITLATALRISRSDPVLATALHALATTFVLATALHALTTVLHGPPYLSLPFLVLWGVGVVLVVLLLPLLLADGCVC